MRLVFKTDFERDLHQRQVRVQKQLLSSFDPPPLKIFVRLQAGCRPELRREVHSRQAGGRRDVSQANRFRDIDHHKVCRAFKAPFRQARDPGTGCSWATGMSAKQLGDDGKTYAISKAFAEYTSQLLCVDQGARQSIDHWVHDRMISRPSECPPLPASHAGILGDHRAGDMEMQDVVLSLEDPSHRDPRFVHAHATLRQVPGLDQLSIRENGKVCHRPKRDPENDPRQFPTGARTGCPRFRSTATPIYAIEVARRHRRRMHRTSFARDG